jgi:quercetin dioxygenase-like cupin family protein
MRIGYAVMAALPLLAGPAQAQDVMKAAPEHYRVLVENEYVRVVQNTLAPGEKDALHTHPTGWYYVTQPGRMRVVSRSGRTDLWAPAAGEAGWSRAEGPHTSENVGDTPMSYVLIEVKAAARAPAPHRVALNGRGGH